MTNKIIEIINSKLLTPILYMIDEDVLSIVGFFDGNTKLNTIYETQEQIENAIGKEVCICDIRDFNEADRIDIIKNSELIYSESPIVKAMFETAMYEDFNIAQRKKIDIMERQRKDGTVFLS